MRLRRIKVIFSSTYRKGVQVSNEDKSQLGPGEANIQPRHVLQEPNTLPSCNASTKNHDINSKKMFSCHHPTVRIP